MEKMWAGRAAFGTAKLADDFNSSIHFDSKMAKEDITGSMAHAAMLARQGIISHEDRDTITAGLETILSDIVDGTLPIDMEAEDIHMFVEAELTRRIGDVGKRLHTARSRNDQVALDLRMYLKNEAAEIRKGLLALLDAIYEQAEKNQDAIMPGYTHLQRAQPVVFSHHLMAYAMMFMRDLDRLSDCVRRMNVSPLGSCALAGTTYPTDRMMVADALGFDGITMNSMDGVSDRDFCVELLSVLSIIMMHLSRFSEEVILWSSLEFGFVELSDAYTTGSSIMPQKKNSDMAELVRGKTGRVYGDLMGTLTMLKGLPLAYNKDMQEDKESVFDGVETVQKCLDIFAPMLKTMTVKKENMRKAASGGFINATDLADYLTKKGMPFRSAYKIVGGIVAKCIAGGFTLETLPYAAYKAESELFEEDLFEEISLETCVKKRISAGSTGPDSVMAQLNFVKAFLDNAGSN